MRPGEPLPGPVIDIGETIRQAASRLRQQTTEVPTKPPPPPKRRRKNSGRPSTRWLDVIGIGILTARLVTTVVDRLESDEDDDEDLGDEDLEDDSRGDR